MILLKIFDKNLQIKLKYITGKCKSFNDGIIGKRMFFL